MYLKMFLTREKLSYILKDTKIYLFHKEFADVTKYQNIKCKGNQ